LNKLEEGLSSFLRYSEIVRPLARVLSCARKVSRISYNKIEKIINDDPEDVLLTGYKWKLLISTKSTRETLDWESKILLFDPDEMYKMPNVVKYLNEQDFLRWGEFQFRISGQEQILQAYKNNPIEDRLFIPFKDETSGKETYSAGRYIDLEPERDRTPEGRWILDFNKAYNPWCVYSEAYTCPFVPLENWLKVPIRAGEKNYSLKSKRGVNNS